MCKIITENNFGVWNLKQMDYMEELIQVWGGCQNESERRGTEILKWTNAAKIWDK